MKYDFSFPPANPRTHKITVVQYHQCGWRTLGADFNPDTLTLSRTFKKLSSFISHFGVVLRIAFFWNRNLRQRI